MSRYSGIATNRINYKKYRLSTLQHTRVGKNLDEEHKYSPFDKIPKWVVRNLVEQGNCFIGKQTFADFGGVYALDQFFGGHDYYDIDSVDNGYIVKGVKKKYES